VRLDIKNFDVETDADGRFFFTQVPTGRHTITCSFSSPFFDQATVEFLVQSRIPAEVVVIADIKTDAIKESRKDTVRLSSLKPEHRLFRGGYGFGHQPVSMNYLVEVYDKRRRVIMRPSGLKGSVLIKDTTQALEFVRLLTNLETYHLFKYASPDVAFIEVKDAAGKPSYGEMPQEQFKKLGLKSPIVKADESHFFVTRYLVGMAGGLYKVIETVGFDGDYEMKKTLLLSHMDITFPPVPKTEK
jgi:hypothetical protein